MDTLTRAADAQPVEGAPDSSSAHYPLRLVEFLIILGFWSVMAALLSANYLVDPRGRGMPAGYPTAYIVGNFIQGYLWAALTPAIFRLCSRLPLDRQRWISRVLALLCIGLIVSVLVDGVMTVVRTQLVPAPQGSSLSPWTRIARLYFFNQFIMYVAMVAAGYARDYSLRYRARREEAIRLQAHAAQLQAQLADATLKALRSQLNPHFLFNTLNAVSALVERDPRGVRRMIARLSELLRTTLEGPDHQEVPFAQELAFARRYLEIMAIRFQGRLRIHDEIEPAVTGALVPSLIWQPLIENAIKHGTSRIRGVGRVEIRACRSGDCVILSVRDNGPGLPRSLSGDRASAEPDNPVGCGLGLRNTRERLMQLYGPSHRLTLRTLEEGGTEAQVVLPFHSAASPRAAGIAAAG